MTLFLYTTPMNYTLIEKPSSLKIYDKNFQA